MDARQNALMAEMARDAGIERSDFLVRAGEQLERFMSANRGRIRELGGIVLIDDDPDYLAVAVDGTFRSRARVYDDAKAEWVIETEVIETAAELVELYNPADVLQAFADASADDTGLTDSSLLEVDPTAEIEPSVNGADPYAGAPDPWAAGPRRARPPGGPRASPTCPRRTMPIPPPRRSTTWRSTSRSGRSAPRRAC